MNIKGHLLRGKDNLFGEIDMAKKKDDNESKEKKKGFFLLRKKKESEKDKGIQPQHKRKVDRSKK